MTATTVSTDHTEPAEPAVPAVPDPAPPIDPELGMPEEIWLAQAQQEWQSPSWRWQRLHEPLPPSDDPATDELLLQRLHDAEGLLTQIQAMAHQDLRALRDRYRAEQDDSHGPDTPASHLDDDGWVASDVGWALGLSENQVRNRLRRADQYAAHPDTADLAATGTLPAYTLTTLLDHLDTLADLISPTAVHRIETDTLAWLTRDRPKRLTELNRRMRKHILTAQARADAAAAAAAADTPTPDSPDGPSPDSPDGGGQPEPPGPSPAHDARRVTFDSRGDGTAELWAHLPEADALAIAAALDTATEHRAPDEHRTRDQRRADILTTRLTGTLACYGHPHDHPDHTPGPLPQIHLTVTVPIRTTTGHGASPGETPGYGLLPATTIADLLTHPHPTFDALLYHADTGTLAGLAPTGDLTHPTWHTSIPTSPSYTHPPRMRASTRARDQHCRAPGCPRPATHTDTDHITPWPTGPTNPPNTATLCRYHHRLKTHAPHHTLTGTGDGPLTWTTPTHRTYTTHPHDHRDTSPPLTPAQPPATPQADPADTADPADPVDTARPPQPPTQNDDKPPF